MVYIADPPPPFTALLICMVYVALSSFPPPACMVHYMAQRCANTVAKAAREHYPLSVHVHANELDAMSLHVDNVIIRNHNVHHDNNTSQRCSDEERLNHVNYATAWGRDAAEYVHDFDSEGGDRQPRRVGFAEISSPMSSNSVEVSACLPAVGGLKGEKV